MRFLIALACLFVVPVEAKTLLTCGDLTGMSFFKAGGIVDTDQWQKDSISPGRVVLIADDKNEITDVRIQDAGGWMSYKDEGCTVVPTNSGISALIVVNFCKFSIDTYMFTYGKTDIGLLFSQAKSAPAVTKAATMTSNCRTGE